MKFYLIILEHNSIKISGALVVENSSGTDDFSRTLLHLQSALQDFFLDLFMSAPLTKETPPGQTLFTYSAHDLGEMGKS